MFIDGLGLDSDVQRFKRDFHFMQDSDHVDPGTPGEGQQGQLARAGTGIRAAMFVTRIEDNSVPRIGRPDPSIEGKFSA